MGYRFRISQSDMGYLYESAKGRMDAHPDYADKHKRVIRDYPYFKSEREALEAAIKIEKINPYSCQIWAKIEKGDDGIFRILNWWIVTDDIKVPANRAYLNYSEGDDVKAFFFGDEATGIQSIDNGQETTEGAIYNLAGQRLSKIQKGINIVGEKKVMVK